MRYITLDLDSLTPATLAAIVANLSQIIAAGDYMPGPAGTGDTMTAAYHQLVAIVGDDDADEMLQEAGADPETLFEVVAG